MASQAVILKDAKDTSGDKTDADVPLNPLKDAAVSAQNNAGNTRRVSWAALPSETNEHEPDERPIMVPRYTVWPEQKFLRATALLLLVLDSGVAGTIYIMSRKYGQNTIARVFLPYAAFAGVGLLCLVLVLMLCDFCNIRAFRRAAETFNIGESFVKSVSTPLDDDPDYLELVKIEKFRRNFQRARHLDMAWNILSSLLYLYTGTAFVLGGTYLVSVMDLLSESCRC